MEAIIRADSNKKIGIGHIIRAKNLGIFFREKGIKSKIITRSNNISSYFSNFKKNEILFLKKNFSFYMEKKIILNIFKKTNNKKKFFIIDLLNYTKYISLIKQLKNNNVKIILICDHMKKVIFPAELIVNANPCQLRYKYNSKKITYLVGPKYIIMDKSYLNKKKIYFKKKIKKILLTVGGTDQKNLIFSIIQILENYDLELSVSIFTTSASHYLKQLRNMF